MTFFDFVMQFWVLLLSLAVMVVVLVIAIGARAAWKSKQEQPIEIDEALRQRLQQRLLEVSTSHSKTA